MGGNVFEAPTALRCSRNYGCSALIIAERWVLEGKPLTLGVAMEGLANGPRIGSNRLGVASDVPDDLSKFHASHDRLRVYGDPVPRHLIHARTMLREPVFRADLLRYRPRVHLLHVHVLS